MGETCRLLPVCSSAPTTCCAVVDTPRRSLSVSLSLACCEVFLLSLLRNPDLSSTFFAGGVDGVSRSIRRTSFGEEFSRGVFFVFCVSHRLRGGLCSLLYIASCLSRWPFSEVERFHNSVRQLYREVSQ